MSREAVDRVTNEMEVPSYRRSYEHLLEELKCPVCMKYMMSHIKMCENGHNICINCDSRVSTCPSCRGQILDVRNIALENIAKGALHPCKNRKAGCAETVSGDKKSDHESKCLYQSTECPFKKLSDVTCPWTGILSDIENHVELDHSDEILQAAGVFRFTLRDVGTQMRYRKVIFTWGTMFYLLWEIRRSAFYFSAFHFGPETGEFTYKFKIQKGREYNSVRGICHSYLKDKREVLQPCGCVMLQYGTVQKYLNGNRELVCDTEIRWDEVADALSVPLHEAFRYESELSSDIHNDVAVASRIQDDLDDEFQKEILLMLLFLLVLHLVFCFLFAFFCSYTFTPASSSSSLCFFGFPVLILLLLLLLLFLRILLCSFSCLFLWYFFCSSTFFLLFFALL